MPLNDVIQCLNQNLPNAKVRVFGIILRNIFHLSRPVTCRSIAAVGDVSHSTVSRFFASWFDWNSISLTIFKKFAFCPQKVYIGAFDEVVEGKAGKHTYGKSLFFSNVLKKSIPAVSMLAVSLIDVETKQSYPVANLQIVKNEQDKERSLKQKQKAEDLAKRKKSGEAPKPKGRKKGVPNKPKESQEPPTLVFRHAKKLLSAFFSKINSLFGHNVVSHVVADGGFGHAEYFFLALGFNTHLITKLKANSALRTPFDGPQKEGRGRKKMYGTKIDFKNLDKKYLNSSKTVDGVQEDLYQFQALSKEMKGTPLNVVVVVQTSLETQTTGHAVFASTDLTLDAQTLIRYYRLRFEIEIDFRDCKQYFGLSDFKNYKQLQVTNAINIAFCSKTLIQVLLSEYRTKMNNPDLSIADLKAIMNAERKANLILKMIREKPHLFLNNQVSTEAVMQIAQMDAVNIKTRA